MFYILSPKTHKSLTLTSVCCLSQDYAATGSCFFDFILASELQTLSSHETFSLPKCSHQPEKSALCCTHDQVSYQYSAIANRWSYRSVQWHGTTCKKNHIMLLYLALLFLMQVWAKIPFKKKKENFKYYNSCTASNHSIGHKVIYNYNTML